MNRTSISYADFSWNPIRGCRRVSPGCEHCWAEKMAVRFSGPGQPYEGIADVPSGGRHGQSGRTRTGVKGRWTGEVRLIEAKLDEPLRARRSAERFLREHGRKPIVFVMDMGDLFYERVPDEWIDRVFAAMALAPWFDYLVLTKRADRMADYITGACSRNPGWRERAYTIPGVESKQAEQLLDVGLPLPCVWLGGSAENQETFDARWEYLRRLAVAGWQTWLSLEPLLGPISMRLGQTFHLSADVEGLLRNKSFDALQDEGRPLSPSEAKAQLLELRARGVKLIKGSDDCVGFSDQTGCPGHEQPRPDRIAIGGESGPGARPCAVEWIESLVRQAQAAGVPRQAAWGEADVGYTVRCGRDAP